MTEIKTAALDAVLDDLRRALRRCDDEDIGLRAAVHIDLAIHFLDRERSGKPQRRKFPSAKGVQNLLIAAAVAGIAPSAESLFWFA